jgi:phage terminase large subunit-like protein
VLVWDSRESIKAIDPKFTPKLYASLGEAILAELVCFIYENGRIQKFRKFPYIEDQIYKMDS